MNPTGPPTETALPSRASADKRGPLRGERHSTARFGVLVAEAQQVERPGQPRETHERDDHEREEPTMVDNC
jgi:hypothetical protein